MCSKPSQYSQISLQSINWSDDSFSLRFGRPPYLDGLRRSIESTGLLNGPVVILRKDGFYTIICGFARLNALHDLGENEVAAYCLQTDTNDAALLKIAITDNTFGRKLNCIEQAMAMEKAAAWLPSHQIAQDILPILELPAALSVLERLLGYRSLPLSVQSALASGELPEGLIPDLRNFRAEDQECLCACILKMRMTLGTGKEFLRNLNEISKRDAISLPDLLQRFRYDGAATCENAEIPQARSQLLEKIRQCRYPILVSLHNAYQEHQKALALAPTISLKPPKDFEGDEYILQARLTSLRDFENLARHLAEQATRNHEHLRNIFDIQWDD